MKREDQIWRVEAADLNSYYKGSYSHQNIMVSDKLTADYISRDHHRTLRKTDQVMCAGKQRIFNEKKGVLGGAQQLGVQ